MADKLENQENKKGLITRRDFLKIAGIGTGAFFVGNSMLGEYIEKLNPEIPKIQNTLSEYKLAWQARPWVWVNLAIASKLIDNFIVHPGEEVSLINLLGFDKMKNVPRENTNPQLGYIAAQMSNPLKLDGWGYGLCLASTALYRACLYSPLRITERGTHYEIYDDYFKDLPIGTDAAVFYPETGDNLPKTDLKLLNPTNEDLRIHFRVYDSFGKLLNLPEKDISEVIYKATYLDQLVRILRNKVSSVSDYDLPEQYLPEQMFGNKKIIVQAVVSGKNLRFKTDISPIRSVRSKLLDGNPQYEFNRTLSFEDDNGAMKSYSERFVSQYK